MLKPMPSRRASANSGAGSAPGISVSDQRSSSASDLMDQRGKKVVSASSGNTTRPQPRAFARRSSATSRSTTCARVSSLAMGPSWAAPTVTMRWLTVISRLPEPIAASCRLVAGQRHPVHEPTEAVVVVDRIVLGATVVQEGDGARRPAEPAGELGLHLGGEQELQERRALPPGQLGRASGRERVWQYG